jgi:hypothetical protein
MVEITVEQRTFSNLFTSPNTIKLIFGGKGARGGMRMGVKVLDSFRDLAVCRRII